MVVPIILDDNRIGMDCNTNVRSDMKKVYIAGPISGMPDYNRAAFKAAAQKLLELGYMPINPHNTCASIVINHTGTEKDLWIACMKEDIKQLMDCDYIYLLEGWENSKGCQMEIVLARELNIKEFAKSLD